MHGGRVASAALLCAVVMFAGCSLPTRGQAVRAKPVSVEMAPATAAAPTTLVAVVPPSAAGPAPPTAVLPDTSLEPRPKTANARVSGRARGADGTASRHVVVGFTKVTCPRCAPMTVVTDDDGAYAVSVPPDAYVVACTAGPRVCSVAGSSKRADTVTIRSTTRLDLSVQGGAPTGMPVNDSVYGQVRTVAGAPVPDTTIELVQPYELRHRLFADTMADGSYRLAVAGGVYLVACITPTTDYECGPVGGDGNPYAVRVANGPQRIDFLLCRSRDYPGCLSR